MKNTTTKPILIFDITILSVGDIKSGSRSGIFWVSWNLFQCFAQDPTIELWVYCQPKAYIYADRFLRKHLKRKFKLVNQTELSKFWQYYSYALFYKEENKRNKQNIRKCLWHYCTIGLRILNAILDPFRNTDWSGKQLESVNFFFSPIYAAPKEIMASIHIKRCFMLYDAMPILFPHFFPLGCKWFSELINQFSEEHLYFVDSDSARNDFLKVLPHMKPNQIITTPIATNIPLRPQTDKRRIKTTCIKYGLPLNKRYIFSLCTMEIRKNIPFLIDGYIKFCRKNHIKDCCLVLAGSLADEQLKKYKNEPNIKFIGYVDDEDLEFLYSSAMIFVYLSLYEGFGMPILEAMSCKCPVICSNVSSMPEVLGDCGILVNPLSTDDLIYALEQYYFDERFRNNCAIKGWECSKTFSWNRCYSIIRGNLEKNNA